MLRGVLRFRAARRLTRIRSDEQHTNAQALILTDRAVNRLKNIARDNERLRITVEGGGCAGFEYKLGLDDTATQSDDVIVERNGAAVVIDEV